MALLQWRPEYSLGVASVDFEHKQLIELINQLAIEIDGPFNEDAIENFFGELHAITSAHFALEERAMVKANYPEFSAHKADHEILLEQIREMMDQFCADPEKSREILKETLEQWFARHFSSFDARLHGALGV